MSNNLVKLSSKQKPSYRLPTHVTTPPAIAIKSTPKPNLNTTVIRDTVTISNSALSNLKTSNGQSSALQTPPNPTISSKKATEIYTTQMAATKKVDTTDVNTMVKNLTTLDKYTKDYLTFDTVERINDHNLEYIRSTKYDGAKWTATAGIISKDHIKHIESKNKSLDKFFSQDGAGANLKDPVTGGKIDFIHMAATIDGILSSTLVPDAWAGWAGDLQTALVDLQENTNDSNKMNILNAEAKKIIGGNSTFSKSDLLADVDAVNIANMMIKNDKLLLSDAIEKYYSKSGKVHDRYTEFVKSFGGEQDFKKSVDRNLDRIDVIVKVDKVDIKIFSLMAPLAEKGFKKHGMPTDNQINAISGAFKTYVLDQVKQEKKR